MLFTRRETLALFSAAAAQSPLLEQWHAIAREMDGPVGAAALNLTTGEMVSLRGNEPFPLASVCKLPIAIAILAMVDEGKLSLDQKIDIPVYDIFPGVSPIADRWGNQKQFPLIEMVELMVAKSDNTAVQTLFRLCGGEVGMAARFRQWKVKGMRLDRSERQCTLESVGVTDIPPVASWTPGMGAELIAKVPADAQLAAFRRFIKDPRDTATPLSAVDLLGKLFRNEALSKATTTRLLQILESTNTGPGRIKGMLPAGTIVAHKTGTTTTVGGLNGATNDVGIVSGKFALAVFVSASMHDQDAREKVIAKIARATFDAW